MKVHYLEIVTTDAESVCKAYEATNKITFSEPEPLLGGARTSVLADGTMVGVRGQLRENETPVVRPYWLVEDIEKAIADVEANGAEVAVPPMEIPGKGKFAIYILSSVEHGFWQI
ncbi:hypothetical protein GCE9029_02640 [Grimontia celer]|uniref:Hydroxylase n=1 Tax=Grimontia celer TaxID=1796497 RepID=A0A128F403_9GAMM|nr:hypothetical protein [Grimontia celer]CZF81489.1 hypothetical protein GCE9029_02640 [Grimontia celer]